MTLDLFSIKRTVKFYQNQSRYFFSTQQNKRHPDVTRPKGISGVSFRLYLPSVLAFNTAEEENYTGHGIQTSMWMEQNHQKAYQNTDCRDPNSKFAIQ